MHHACIVFIHSVFVNHLKQLMYLTCGTLSVINLDFSLPVCFISALEPADMVPEALVQFCSSRPD